MEQNCSPTHKPGEHIMRHLDVSTIEFQHLIDLPNCDCVFCSTIENSTGQSRLFLVFNERRRIYIRNGLNNSWDELKDEFQYECIRDRFNRAIMEQEIPCFST